MKMDEIFSLKGKIVIVTGAARGNGRTIAEGYLGAGAIVYFLDILREEINQLKTQRPQDFRARFLVADVTDFPLMEKIIRDIYEKEGNIDVLVNNAAVTLPDSTDIYSEEKWERTYMIDLKAPFKVSQIVARYMKRRQSGGVIINITSICSEQGFSNNPAYMAFKGGLKQLTKAFAKDWAKYNIRVNNLGLGYFRTEMTRKSWEDKDLRRERAERTMLKRWGEPEDIVGPAIFLASDASRYMTAQDLYIDGGWLANGI